MRMRKLQIRKNGLFDDRGPISDVEYVFSHSSFSPTRFAQRPQHTRVVVQRVKSFTAHSGENTQCAVDYTYS